MKIVSRCLKYLKYFEYFVRIDAFQAIQALIKWKYLQQIIMISFGISSKRHQHRENRLQAIKF